MSNTLQFLLRRDPSRDRKSERINYEGYTVHWPDGTAVGVGADAFCQHGQRLLGLGRKLNGHSERHVNITCVHLGDGQNEMTRIPGHRVRRFYIERHGRQGRVHFFDGTPTAIVLDTHRDEPAVLAWVGLNKLREGERQWFDLAAVTVDPSADFPSLTSSGITPIPNDARAL